MNHIRFPVRVYWEDTDAGGIVYHANYLKFMERARSDMLRRIGFGQNDQRGREDGVLFVVASLNIAYHRAAVLDDDLEVITSIEKLGAPRSSSSNASCAATSPSPRARFVSASSAQGASFRLPCPTTSTKRSKPSWQRKPERPSPNTLSFNAIQKAVI